MKLEMCALRSEGPDIVRKKVPRVGRKEHIQKVHWLVRVCKAAGAANNISIGFLCKSDMTLHFCV